MAVWGVLIGSEATYLRNTSLLAQPGRRVQKIMVALSVTLGAVGHTRTERVGDYIGGGLPMMVRDRSWN